MKGFLLFLCLIPCLVGAQPWGKDADLARKFQAKSAPKKYGISDLLIDFHQQVISPCDGPRSHFIPCSSKYARQAIHKYGFLVGFMMGCDRLMRENREAWVYRTTPDGEGHFIKYDPVP